MELPPANRRADTPYDQERDRPPGDDLLVSTRALFALAAGAALVVGVCCATVGLILTAATATWTGIALMAAGVVVLRALWVRGQE